LSYIVHYHEFRGEDVEYFGSDILDTSEEYNACIDSMSEDGWGMFLQIARCTIMIKEVID